jgi:hypothetical protein
MATSPGFQKRGDGNVYYVIGGNTMRVHEVLYKKGAQLTLDGSDGSLNLKGRTVYINGIDLTDFLNVVKANDSTIATNKSVLQAIDDHTTTVQNRIKANTNKVAAITGLKKLAAAYNTLATALGNDKTIPETAEAFSGFENISKINKSESWSEEDIIDALNQVIDVVNALFSDN